jgi:hypothetical protein
MTIVTVSAIIPTLFRCEYVADGIGSQQRKQAVTPASSSGRSIPIARDPFSLLQ